MAGNRFVKTHDLLWICERAHLISQVQPKWVRATLQRAPVVVVRRAEASPGLIPVGIRGRDRTQRHAALLRLGDVVARRTPQSLAADQVWRKPYAAMTSDMFRALELFSEVAEKFDLVWGPVGSVGFQLGTGMPTIKSTSDLDIVILCPGPVDRYNLSSLYENICDCRPHIDVILERQLGAVALEEYLKNRNVLVKTALGPRLAALSW
jgi:phosphoribosyl-dephospho-CoA transferase